MGHHRGQFITIKKEYKKIIRQQKRKFEVDQLNKLQTLTSDPKKFWNQLKKINKSNKKSNTICNLVPPCNWIDHFSNINKKDPSTIPSNFDHCKEIDNQVSTMLTNAQNCPNCPILDRDFSQLEIKNAIKQLKKGKASALDAISNEILITAS